MPASRTRFYAHRAAVRPPRPVFKLVFALPASLRLVAPGRHQPNPDGPTLVIDRSGWCSVLGPSRREVLEHAGRFLKSVAKGRGPIKIIGATLVTPPNYYPGAVRGGRDGYTIVIGAEVSFSPTTVGVEVVSDQSTEETA